MSALYNRFAGNSVERLAALSDGLFAIAMTLLVLDLQTPVRHSIHSEQDLWQALTNMAPNLVTYFMSFLTLGIFWVGQQTQLNHFARSDRNLAWIHLAFLLAVSLTPFSTRLLSEFIEFRLALVIYWLNILLLGVALLGSWKYASRKSLIKDDTTTEVRAAHERRIVVAQVLYALGALLCVVSTYWSITAIVLVQLNFAIAPRFLPLYRF